ncbi:MAG TPA: hypothetical protein VMB23_03925 [Spirochaetia bacterium]|jgi:hypothetical protein|nr:hypothetical protein [Spirochaetia bacterium]
MTRYSETLVGTDLNSVWLEGTLDADPVGSPGAEPMTWSFQVQNPRPPEPPSVFQVEAPDRAFLGNRCRVGRGRRVRVIGRLRQQGSQVNIYGELVELIGTTG